jgi:hypothetical protein
MNRLCQAAMIQKADRRESRNERDPTVCRPGNVVGHNR